MRSGGRLAGPVRSEKPVDVAALDRQIDPIDRGQPAIAFDQTANFGRARLVRRDHLAPFVMGLLRTGSGTIAAPPHRWQQFLQGASPKAETRVSRSDGLALAAMTPPPF
jgi:hypothetical protein